jgi:hypothetical protein
MSYLFPLATTTELGQVQIGSNITVDPNSIISIPQSVAITSDVTFNSLNATTSLSVNGTPVVYKLIAGDNITLSATSGIVTIAATGEGIAKTVGTATNYTATATDEYIGVTATPAAITLPTGITGKIYTVKNEVGSGNVTVKGTGAEKLDGSTTKTLNSYGSLSVVFRNGNWNII